MVNERKNKLSSRQIDLLNELNFDWRSQDLYWFMNYEKLKKFYLKDGHTNPFWNKTLGPWCDEQRAKQKKWELTQEQINLLEDIEFQWE